jgi:hypothetical protein
MSKPPKPKVSGSILPGARRRFERVVDHMLNTPPKQHESLKAQKRKAKKKAASAP